MRFFTRQNFINLYNYLFKKVLKVRFIPQARSLYAFTRFRKGEFLLFLNTKDNVYEFMQLPDRYIVNLTDAEFNQGIAEKLLDFVEIIPEEVFEVCKVNIQETTKI